jgi:hypothetical protein
VGFISCPWLFWRFPRACPTAATGRMSVSHWIDHVILAVRTLRTAPP